MLGVGLGVSLIPGVQSCVHSFRNLQSRNCFSPKKMSDEVEYLCLPMRNFDVGHEIDIEDESGITTRRNKTMNDIRIWNPLAR